MNAVKAFQVSFTASVLRDAHNEGAIDSTAFGNLRWRFAAEFGLDAVEREVFFNQCREDPEPAIITHQNCGCRLFKPHTCGWRDPDAAD